MKKAILILLTAMPILTMAQSWQWGKRGGSTNVINTQGSKPPEQVYSYGCGSQYLFPVGSRDQFPRYRCGASGLM